MVPAVALRLRGTATPLGSNHIHGLQHLGLILLGMVRRRPLAHGATQVNQLEYGANPISCSRLAIREMSKDEDQSLDCERTATSSVECDYDGMRLRAKTLMLEFPGAHSLQPTAVVHEAFMKLWRKGSRPKSRKEFMAAISQAMRDVLIDNLRKRLSQKRGSGSRGVPLESDVPNGSWRLLSNKIRVHEAMGELREKYPRIAIIFEMRFFGGFTLREIAGELRVSIATVERDASHGRAVMYALLKDD